MRNILTLKNLLALIFVAAGTIFLYDSYKPRSVFYFSPDEMGPMTYPRYLLWGWVGLSTLYLLIPRQPVDLQEIRDSFPALTATVITIVIYMVLLKYVGLFLSTFLFLILFLYSLHYRTIRKMVPIALATALTCWIIFEKLLGVSMPPGVFKGFFV